jgi:hypothetical protein
VADLFLDFGAAHLREEGPVVFNVPVVGDAAVGDFQQVGRDEIDRLSLTRGLAEGPSEMAVEFHVDCHVIVGDDQLANLDGQVRRRRAKMFRREGRTLRTAGRERVVGEVW